MAIVSEIIRFVLPQSHANDTGFHMIRKVVAEKGFARTQYFGSVMFNEGGGGHGNLENQMCWYIKWPEEHIAYRKSEPFKSELSKLTSSAQSLLVKFTETKDGEVTKGLESHACEFAVINLDLSSKPPRFEKNFEHSMHKAFTDCYFAKGFTGGAWSYVLNSNNADGEEILGDQRSGELVPESERLLAYYCLGWDSIADHHTYAKSELFAEEIDRLKPYFGAGTGTFYVKFEKHMQ